MYKVRRTIPFAPSNSEALFPQREKIKMQKLKKEEEGLQSLYEESRVCECCGCIINLRSGSQKNKAVYEKKGGSGRYYVWHCKKGMDKPSRHIEHDWELREWGKGIEPGHIGSKDGTGNNSKYPTVDYNCACWAEGVSDEIAEQIKNGYRDQQFKEGEVNITWLGHDSTPVFVPQKMRDESTQRVKSLSILN